MPLLAFFGPGKLILYGVIALAVAGAYGVWTYRGNKIDRLERENAAARVEIAATAATANENAAAAARIKADWERADQIVIQRNKELADAEDRIKAAQRMARARPASQCGPGERLLAYVGGLRQPSAAAVDGTSRRDSVPRPTPKPARP